MAEEVEITNYGKGGVASEETLSALLRSMEKLAKKEGFNPKDVAKKTKDLSNAMKDGVEIVTKNRDALKDHTDTVKESNSVLSKSFGVLGVAAGAFANRLTAFATEVAVGGTTLTGFAKELPLVGTLLAPLTQVIDDNVEIYREFSTIGGVAADGLYDFTLIAARAGIPMDNFRQLVMENSESMKLFGATTTSGATALAALSKEFRDGPGRSLMQLGFTSEELNETLVDLAELNTNIFTMSRMREKVTARSATEFSNTLFDLSVITGKRRDQVKQEMQQNASDFRARVALSKMSTTQQNQFNANLTIGGDTMKDALLDVADGIPNTEIAQRLMTFSSVFRDRSRDIQNMDVVEMTNFLLDVRDEIDKFQVDQGKGLEAIAGADAGIRGMLAFSEEAKDLREINEADAKRMADEKTAAKQREDAILQFAEVLNTIRGELTEKFITSGVLDIIKDSAESLISMITPERVKTFGDNLKEFIDLFSKDPINAISNALSGIGNKIKDILLGEIQTEPGGPNRGKRDGGLVEDIMTSITEGIENIWEDLTLIEKVGVAAAALFAVGGVIASPLIAGITGLFAAKVVTDAMLNGAKSLFGSASDIDIDGGKDGKNKKSPLGKITKHFDDFAKITKKLPYVGAVISGAFGYFDKDYADAGYGGADRMALGIAEGSLELVDMLANLTGNGVDLITGRDDFGRADLAGSFKDAAVSDTWLRTILTLGKPYENTNTPPPTAEDLAIADATSIGIAPSIVPPSLPTLPDEPMREDFDSWWQKERKEEQNYKEAMKNYHADVTEIMTEFKASVAEYNAKLAGSNQASDTKVQQDLNTAMKMIAEIAARQEKYLNKIAKNTGGTPSDVSSAPTNLNKAQ